MKKSLKIVPFPFPSSSILIYILLVISVKLKNECYSFGLMVLVISYDNSEVGAHVRSNLCYLICLKHLIRSRGVTNRIDGLNCPPLFRIKSLKTPTLDRALIKTPVNSYFWLYFTIQKRPKI